MYFPSLPENYLKALALPIARRPLLFCFYKTVVIRNPQIVATMKEMMKRSQPYLGAFLLKVLPSESTSLCQTINGLFSATSLPTTEHAGSLGAAYATYIIGGKPRVSYLDDMRYGENDSR